MAAVQGTVRPSVIPDTILKMPYMITFAQARYCHIVVVI